MGDLETIFARRSIRDYTDQKVEREKIEKLLKAGMAAPSARNEQPWHFVVIDEGQTLTEIPKFHAYSKMLKEASAAIVVCGDIDLLPEERGSEVGRGYLAQDCSAATENILLAAQALGLGAVWLGVYPVHKRMDGLRDLLDLPENIVPFSIVSLGYPAEEKPPNDRYEEDRVHWNDF